MPRPKKRKRRNYTMGKTIWELNTSHQSHQGLISATPLLELLFKQAPLFLRRVNSKNGTESKPEKSFQVSKKKFRLLLIC